MKTSNFWKARGLKNQIAISVGVPRWWRGKRYLKLAPTREMLKMNDQEHDIKYNEILNNLDPKEVYEELGSDSVLLCWEKPGEKCHRRRVAEWLEKHLDIEVTEHGYIRKDVKPYNYKEKKIKQEMLF